MTERLTNRVTDFRVDRITMSASSYHLLPQPVKDLIHAYAEKIQQDGALVRFELAIYRWDEIMDELRKWSSAMEKGL